jgi:hypothetical protein
MHMLPARRSPPVLTTIPWEIIAHSGERIGINQQIDAALIVSIQADA